MVEERQNQEVTGCAEWVRSGQIRDLKAQVERLTGVPEPVSVDPSRVVALVEYRDGTLLDSVFRVDC